MILKILRKQQRCSTKPNLDVKISFSASVSTNYQWDHFFRITTFATLVIPTKSAPALMTISLQEFSYCLFIVFEFDFNTFYFDQSEINPIVIFRNGTPAENEHAEQKLKSGFIYRKQLCQVLLVVHTQFQDLKVIHKNSKWLMQCKYEATNPSISLNFCYARHTCYVVIPGKSTDWGFDKKQLPLVFQVLYELNYARLFIHDEIRKAVN